MAKNEDWQPTVNTKDIFRQLEKNTKSINQDIARQSAEDDLAMRQQISANQETRVNKILEDANRNRTTFSIDTFRSEINKAGILPAHSFLLYINPQGIPNSKVFPSTLVMRMESAQIPGVNIMSQDVFRYGYGPNIRMPHGAQYNVMSASFLVDGSAENYKFFYEWMSLVVNHESKGGSEMTVRNKKRNMYPYQVGYKRAPKSVKRPDTNDPTKTVKETVGVGGYALGQMTLTVYDRSNNRVMNCTFYDVYPMQLSDMDLRWSDVDNPVRATVQFSFTDLDISFTKLSEMDEIVNASNPQNEIASIKSKKDTILSSLSSNIKIGAQSAVDAVTEEGASTINRQIYKVIKTVF